MAYTLYLRLTGTREEGEGETVDYFDWVLLDTGGDFVAEGQSSPRDQIETALEEHGAGNVRLVGVIPAFDVSYCTARIPGRQKRVILQALPYSVEEQVAQDIEDMHLVLGERLDGEWQVGAVDRTTMQQHLARFHTWQRPISAVYADAMLLPSESNRWTVLVEDEQALVHGENGEWYDVPLDGLAVFTESLLATWTEETPPRIVIHTSPDVLERKRMELAALEQNPDALVTIEELTVSPLRLMAECHSAESSRPIDLCQGEFAQYHSGHSPWRPWVPVGVIAGVAFVIQLGLMVAEGLHFQERAETYEARAMEVYRELFPDDTRATADNVQRILTGRLRAAERGEGGTDFLTLLRYAGYEYLQAENNERIRFDAINFSRQRGELVVELRGESFSQLDNMRSGLSSAGLQARIGSVVNEEDHTRGRLTIAQGG